MKKTILLLVTIASLSTTYAQYNSNQQNGNNGHDMVMNTSNKDYGYDRGTYFFSAKDKDMQIADINRSYDKKVQSVKGKFFMSRFQKDKMISNLQAQRTSEINAVNARFYDKKNLFNQQSKRFDNRKDDKKHNNW